MFLSDAQLFLVSDLATNAKLDILDCNVSTVSALSVRGIVQVNVARNAGEITNVTLTDTGYSIAGHIDFYANPPKYYDVLHKNSKDKQRRKKWISKHKKVT